MKQLLLALDQTHSRGVFHRDIKPSNIMVDISNMNIKIIDWGLAEFYLPGKEYNVRVASRPFKPVEILSNCKKYGYSFDIWSAGCIFAGLIFRKDYMFPAKDNAETMLKIIKTLGSEKYFDYISKYELRPDHELMSRIIRTERKSWHHFIDTENGDLQCEKAYGLLDRMLVYDPEERLTAKEALEHNFFN